MKFKVRDRIVQQTVPRAGVIVEVYEGLFAPYGVRLDDTRSPDVPLPCCEDELRLEAEPDPRRALVELAQAASLVVAEFGLQQVELQDAALIELHEDVERLRLELVKHMPAIEAAQAGGKT